jgi:hypothetical protein
VKATHQRKAPRVAGEVTLVTSDSGWSGTSVPQDDVAWTRDMRLVPAHPARNILVP